MTHKATTLILNEHQQKVVDRLRMLPGSRNVTIESTIFVDGEGRTHSSMTIRGGADGPDPIKCDHCEHRRGQSYISIQFIWSNNKYDKTLISVNHGAALRPPRRRCGLTRGLEYMDRFVQEEFLPTMEGIK